MHTYTSLDFSDKFLDHLVKKGFGAAEHRQIAKALVQLDVDETHSSLNVHQLHGREDDMWTAYVSRSIRITFARTSGGRKSLVSCSRHYDD